MIVGIVGAGQLARMMALAGYPLGVQFLMYDRVTDTPGGQVAPSITGEFDDLERLGELASLVDVVTFDWENVPAASIRALAKQAPVAPGARALEIAQDRLAEKRLFTKLGLGVAPHAKVDTLKQLEAAVKKLGLPGILKTRRLGYDGKGQRVIRTPRDVVAAWEGLKGQPLVYEGFVEFDREVSLVSARGRDGSIVHYPLAENVHVGGVLSVTRAPYADRKLQAAAEAAMTAVLGNLRYVGVLCIEFFVARGRLVANEMAPRVHNSGHWSIEGAVTSQFENHIRAITGLALGPTTPRGHSGMVNYLGTMPAPPEVAAIPGAHLHAYGKEPRPGRKLGHATYVADTPAERDRGLRRLLATAGRER